MWKKHLFTIVIEKDADGYFVYCPQLQGCYSQGDTYEEAMKNIEDAIRLHLEDRKSENEIWKESGAINVTSLELAF
ncbi:type II toxin-antitoxin system HicB family antitoxin [Candidatus Peregrinibacteria bacterium]|nr:type II toxin-antitoxin system HicB family antitoxin [Candidatus Peregrinibacteria bacterium]